jgi:ubiquinone/menaquinone biosynthesis C-methylase UbiE
MNTRSSITHMQNPSPVIARIYDRIAERYDLQWSRHVRRPQQRLTRGLMLQPGMRSADLGCGTGVDTLEMSRLSAPGEVIAVDCSQGMLDTVRRRAEAESLPITTCLQGAEEFIAAAPRASFDAVTLRFCLGYFDWPTVLSRLPSMLCSGGRLGILTILSSSAPQAYETYREMIGDLGLPEFGLTALDSVEQVTQSLEQAGCEVEDAWVESFRLAFDTGAELAEWLRESGIATAKNMPPASNELLDLVWSYFGERVEARRVGTIVPLDFEIAGVIARL